MTPQQAEVLLETMTATLRNLIDTADDIEYARGYLKTLLAHVDSLRAKWDKKQ